MSPIPQIEANPSPYDRIARFYDFLSWFYSGGGICRAKNVHLSYLQPGVEVLYAGAGTGAECVEAAKRGARVTAVDSSSAMLSQLESRFMKAGLRVNLIRGDVRSLDQRVDAVVAPFFLNVFTPDQVAAVLSRLSANLRPNGLLISIDFHRPSHSRLVRLIQKLYYLPPLALFYLTTGNPWHELYDYRAITERTELPLSLLQAIPTKAFGLPLFETLIWKRQ